MVSVTLFSVIMLVSVGSLLSLVDANRKARALESVMNNLNIAIDGMVRSMRMGNAFNCNSTAVPDAEGGGDCPNGEDSVSFAPFGADPTVQTDRWEYAFIEDENGGRLWRSREGGLNLVPITAPEVRIDDVSFYVYGTPRGNTAALNTTQPKIVMVIKGTAGIGNAKTETTFYIQATAVQRVLDL